MLRSWRQPAKLFSDFNTLQFAGVMGMVVLIVLLALMVNGAPTCHGTSIDLAKVSHPTSMPWADREDAMLVSITRDGKVYFGVEQVIPADLQQKISDRLKDRSAEKKVYIKADMRARWGGVKEVLDGVRASGVLRVAFLVDERRALSARFEVSTTARSRASRGRTAEGGCPHTRPESWGLPRMSSTNPVLDF